MDIAADALVNVPAIGHKGPPSERDRVRLCAGLDCSAPGTATAAGRQTRPVAGPGSGTLPPTSWSRDRKGKYR